MSYTTVLLKQRCKDRELCIPLTTLYLEAPLIWIHFTSKFFKPQCHFVSNDSSWTYIFICSSWKLSFVQQFEWTIKGTPLYIEKIPTKLQQNVKFCVICTKYLRCDSLSNFFHVQMLYLKINHFVKIV